MLWRKPSLLLIKKKEFDTVNKTEKSQTSKITVDTPKINKTNTVKSLDYSRSTHINDKVTTVHKSRSISISTHYNKSIRIENHSEIYIHKDNLSVSVLSRQGERLSSVTPDTLCITCKN